MASMALLIKVHKKNLPGRAYLSQIDAPSYKIYQELTRVMNPIDKKGESKILEYGTKILLRLLGVVGIFLQTYHSRRHRRWLGKN